MFPKGKDDLLPNLLLLMNTCKLWKLTAGCSLLALPSHISPWRITWALGTWPLGKLPTLDFEGSLCTFIFTCPTGGRLIMLRIFPRSLIDGGICFCCFVNLIFVHTYTSSEIRWSDSVNIIFPFVISSFQELIELPEQIPLMYMNCIPKEILAYLPQQTAGFFIQSSAQLGPAI